jgi:uncharacterized protein YbaP (TraB family)
MTQPLHDRAPWRRVLATLVATAFIAASIFAHSAAATRDFIWKISGKQNVVYLVGSVHMLSKDFYPLGPAFDNAFKESDLLVEELDLGEATSGDAGFALLSHAMLPEDQSLEGVLSPATYDQVSRHLADLGVPIEPLKRLKPWMLAVTFEELEWQKAGYDPDLGLDKHFYDLAQAEGKAVQGFETAEFQLSLFDGMPMDQQDRMLADTLKDLDTEINNVNRMADAWKAGDALAVERIVLPDLQQDPAMYKRLLVDRNRNWLPKIDALLARRGHAFVVVGAAHLLGPDGLLALLKAKGYAVDQM